jgi:hypothetical protein
MAAETLWDRVDEPVLRWVASLPPSRTQDQTFEFPTTEPQPFAPIDGLDTWEVADSLHRLHSHGLIGGGEHLTSGLVDWSQLRVTATGCIVLGEWPDVDRAATAVSVHGILRRLGEAAGPEDRGPLLRTAGYAGGLADGVIQDLARSAGREAVE